ncbi:MAG: hypothetical protein CO149_01030 [Nitrospirae bacterium CG_4_9_14_3_um_filter_51_5]|nr:MAG: hypothetical protein CO149_01030 [Nitrospirae bacterium CG_4_9_14_3_um_filter_51_5]
MCSAGCDVDRVSSSQFAIGKRPVAGYYAFFISYLEELAMKYRKQVHYVKGVFACPKCHQHFVQEKWLEEFRVRCHKCDYRGALTHVSVEEQMDEEIERR